MTPKMEFFTTAERKLLLSFLAWTAALYPRTDRFCTPVMVSNAQCMNMEVLQECQSLVLKQPELVEIKGTT